MTVADGVLGTASIKMAQAQLKAREKFSKPYLSFGETNVANWGRRKLLCSKKTRKLGHSNSILSQFNSSFLMVRQNDFSFSLNIYTDKFGDAWL